MTAQQRQIGEAFRVQSYYYGLNGLGDARPITNAIGAGLLASGGVISKIPGGQLPGAIVSAVGILTQLIGGFFKPDLTKIEATHIVDQIAAQLDQLEASWRSLPADQKTQTNQAAYLEVVQGAFDKVRQGCSNPALGTAGQNCISERLVRGGSAPWCPTKTGCDWYALYYDPIANDSNVVPDSSVASSVTGSIDSAVSGVSSALGGISPLWIGVGLIAFAFLAVRD